MLTADDSFHRTFLRTMFMGFKLGASSKKMSWREKKRAIKLSANIAMAVAASKDMNWSRALIARHAAHGHNRGLVRNLLGRNRYENITKPCFPPTVHVQRMMMMRSRARRTSMPIRGATASSTGGATARVIATSMVKKRTRILKHLVPGGESLDDISLLGETIDYVISLQAQVTLMRMLTEVLGV